VQINSIQYLRGIAALMVAIFHLAPQIERMHLPRPPAGWLMSGVDIFFVISGFIMWWTRVVRSRWIRVSQPATEAVRS